MERSEKIGLINLATENINLRYPNVFLSSIPPSNIEGRGCIKLFTFVQSKDKERLAFVEDIYYITNKENIFKVLKTFKNKFDKTCELVKNSYIFTDSMSIKEPFLINKLKT